MTAKEVKKAEQALLKRMRQPGHSEEWKAFNASRRGTSVRGTSAIPTKKQKALMRSSRKQADRRACMEA